MRTFIAIDLPEHVKAEIFHKFEILKDSGLASGNFVGKENLHLTLKFLGEISEEILEKAKVKLSEINFSEFNVETGKIGFFPSEDYIRTLWIDLICKGNEIFGLQEKIENELSEIGIPKDNRAFACHITTARIKNLKNKNMFLDKLNSVSIKKEKFSVDKFVLIKSELMRSGPTYKVLSEFKAK